MTVPPTPEELEQQLADLQHQLQDQAEQDAAERRQLASTLEGLAQQLDDLDALKQQRSQALAQARAAGERIQELEQQVRDLQAQLGQLQRQTQEPPPASAPAGIPLAEPVRTAASRAEAVRTDASRPVARPPRAAAPPAVSRGRKLLLATAGLGLLLGLGLGLHQQLRQRNPAAAPPPTATAVLELQADQPSWLEVRSSSGRNLFVGELRGRKRFALGSGLQVLAGRPDLVSVRLDNGPARPLGRIEDVNWHRFTPSGSAAQERQQSDQSRNQHQGGEQQN